MKHGTVARAEPLSGPGEWVMAAARCWRAARDCGAPVQQRLHALLSGRNRDMLAPVFDSLLTFYEAALGRKIATGREAPSPDECLLLGLLNEAKPWLARTGCAEGLAAALDCAIRSARIMIALSERENLMPARGQGPQSIAKAPPLAQCAA